MDAMTSPTMRSLALALAAAMAAAVLAGCGDDPESAEDPEPTGETSAASDQPTADPTPGEDSSPSAPTDSTAVPVYFVGEAPNGPVLFREFRQVEADNPLEEAAALLTAGDALDADYRTLFPGGSFESITHEDGKFVATVPDDGWTTPAPGMSKRDARLAAQQLVYTLQGVQQERVPVVVQLGGKPTSLFGIDTSNGLKAAPQLDVLGLVNITTPEEGATVSGTFEASGVASSFEATVPWEIRQGDQAVKEGFATAEGWMDKLHPWTTKVDVSDLAPGEYIFAAMTDDPSGGAEGFGPSEDTKTIVVE
jgi:hypothetical protein